MQPFEITIPVIESKKKQIKITPQKTNRASSAGHPCLKYLVFCRTKWNERLPHDVYLQMIFEAGNMIEDMALKEIQEAGFRVIEQQRSFEWPQFELTGHLDAKVLHPETNQPIPLEVKGLSPFEWERLNSIEDFLQSKKHYIRGYVTQLSLYMLSPGNESELGFFYIKNKLNFQPKAIWLHQDYTYAEDILKKLEKINKHVKEDTLPEGINDYDICNRCGFLHVCLPEMIGKEIEIINEIEIEEAIKRCEELRPLVKEYKEYDEKWKTAIEGKEKVMIGDYVVIGKWIERKGYTVPDLKYWQSKILIKPKPNK